MKKYRVRLYFHTNVDIDVTAEDAQQAIDGAREVSEYLRDKVFMENMIEDDAPDVMVFDKKLNDYKAV